MLPLSFTGHHVISLTLSTNTLIVTTFTRAPLSGPERKFDKIVPLGVLVMQEVLVMREMPIITVPLMSP
jgi:hypothetical protein